MEQIILGVDSGNHKAKVVGPYGVDSYKTNICEWFEQDIKEEHGNDDMEFNIDGRKGFAGTIASIEDDFDGQGAMFGASKNHQDNKIRVLLAIHRYLQKYTPHINNVRIVTGQPLKNHNNDEKDGIINMLKGEHQMIVNGVERTLFVDDVKVSPEGTAAFWGNPQMGTIRILDIGSGTVNAATIVDKKHVTSRSDTFNFGMETVKNKDLGVMARGIIRSSTALKWKKDDIVWVCGGVASEILPFIKEHYINAAVITPKLNGKTPLMPVYANASGFYDIAKRVFK